jgi:hypothetical protein
LLFLIDRSNISYGPLEISGLASCHCVTPCVNDRASTQPPHMHLLFRVAALRDLDV